MKCPKCGGVLSVTHVYSHPGGKLSARECRGCGRRFSVATMILNEIQGRGTGPRATLKRLSLRRSVLVVKEGPPPEQERGRAQAGAGEAPAT